MPPALCRISVVFAGSLALFLGTPNPVCHIPFIILLYPAALFLASRMDSPFRLGWYAGIPGAASALYWIAVAAHRYGAFPWILAAPCSFLLGTYVALWGGCFSWLMARMQLSPGKRCLSAGCLWFLLEWMRGWFCSGFPWLTLSSGLAAWPVLIQPLCVLGEYGYSAVLAGIACAICEGIILLENEASFRRCGRHLVLGCAAAVVMIVAAGAWRLSAMPEILGKEGVPVSFLLVQGNIRQDLKWTQEYQRQTLEKYMKLTLDGVRRNAENSEAVHGKNKKIEIAVSSMGHREVPEKGVLGPAIPDVILWPETAMPFAYPSGKFSEELRFFVRSLGIPLIFGAPGVQKEPGRKTLLYNRAFMLSPEGKETWYDKEHLVPFGEYLPPAFNWKIFEGLLQGLGGFEPGGQQELFSIFPEKRRKLDMGMLICYEAIFPELARRRVADGAEILLNISNDAWYDYSSAPVQHLQLALMRAVEEGRFVVRATNTGITAVLDPLGGIHAMSKNNGEYALFQDGWQTGTVLALQSRTPYFYIHSWIPFCAAVLFLLICFSSAGGGNFFCRRMKSFLP